MNQITANGKPSRPDALHHRTISRGAKLLPRSVVVEHNGEAVAPSEFAKRQLNSDDSLEIVKIVAGG
ncbi:MAG: sulfur carrier protein ThiS [Verrucomicrobiota bacterium]